MGIVKTATSTLDFQTSCSTCDCIEANVYLGPFVLLWWSFRPMDLLSGYRASQPMRRLSYLRVEYKHQSINCDIAQRGCITE